MENEKKTELGIFNSQLVILSESTDIKSLIKANEGKYIAYENDETLKRKLEKIAYIHKKFIDSIDKEKPLTDEQKKGLEKISKYNRTTRYAIQNIRDHNASVITKTQKDKKELQNNFIAVIEPNELSSDDLLKADRERAEKLEAERKERIQLLIDEVEVKLQTVIDETTTYEIIDEKIEEFTKIAMEAKAEKDFEDMLTDFNTMVLEKTEKFDGVVNEITGNHEKNEANKERDAANLKAERMEELFDYNFKYKGEKPLGELTPEEYFEILKPQRFAARKTELEEIGFDFWDEEGFAYSQYEQKFSIEEVEKMETEKWKTEIADIKELIKICDEEAAEFEAETAPEAAPEAETVSHEDHGGEVETVVKKDSPFIFVELNLNEEQIQVFGRTIMQKYSKFLENRGENPLHFEHISEFLATLKSE